MAYPSRRRPRCSLTVVRAAYDERRGGVRSDAAGRSASVAQVL
ncbi:hypothetical protein [Pseudonocardia oceani]|nr:hypothetical protein [Pseudonocardia oceani]